MLSLCVCVSLSVHHRATPAWLRWNNFRCDGVSADNVVAIADALVQSGLAAAGYTYLNVDDCWSAPHLRQDGALQPLPDAFPLGIRALADAIHLRGLKFGLYADRGYKTCAFRPGSRGHEDLHAQQFAEWHVDYLKYDSCFAPNVRRIGALDDYRRMREALNATGRPILFSACGWNWWYSPHTDVAHSVRIAADCDEWANVYEAVRTNEYLAPYATKGHFNDPDMLLGSSPGASAMLTPQRSRAQFALWAVMTSPLLLGLDIFHMTDFDKETYTNLEVIAIDQDPLAVQGILASSTCPPWTLKDYWWCSPWSMPAEIREQWSRALLTYALVALSLCFFFRRKAFALVAVCCLAYVLVLRIYTPTVHPCTQVWTKPLSNGDAAVVFVNWDGPQRSVTCDAACLAYVRIAPNRTFIVRDLYYHGRRALTLLSLCL